MRSRTVQTSRTRAVGDTLVRHDGRAGATAPEVSVAGAPRLAFAAALGVTLLMAGPVVLRALASGSSAAATSSGARTRTAMPWSSSSSSGRGRVPAPYLQPLTDLPGRALARLVGPVAAYNVVVLATFPLSAAAAYLLARYVLGSHLGRDGRRARLRVPALPRRAGRRPPARRADAVAAALLAGLVALRRPPGSPPRRAAARRGRGGRALGFLRRAHRRGAEPGGARRLGGRVAAAAGRGAAGGAWRSRASPSRRRPRPASPRPSLRPRASCCAPAPRLPALGAVPDEREVVELPGPAGGPSAGGRARARVLGRPRRAARRCSSTSRWAWAGRSCVLAAVPLWLWLRGDRSSLAVRSAPVLAAVAVAALLCSLSPERTIGGFRSCARPRCCTRSRRCSGPMRGSAWWSVS